MKRLYLAFILTVIAIGCNEPEQPLEEFYRFKGIERFTLYEPVFKEMVIGESLNLSPLLTIKDGLNNTVEVPQEALAFYANNQRLATDVFRAAVQGTYRLRAGIGNKSTNSITVTVLPAGVYPIIKVPVIFHTINSSLTQSQITNLLTGITASFRNRWRVGNDPKDANSADCYVEFYAAEKDPTGRTLTAKGLDMVSATRSEFTSQQATNEAWNSFWEPTRYLNIWVMKVTGELEYASWAYFPAVSKALAGLDLRASGGTPPRPQGVFLNAKHTNLIPLLAHEVGHVLGLHHVFDGNLDTFSGCTANDPDYCSDTPYYDRNNYEGNSRSLQQNRISCSGISYISTNFMDYDYSYENSFTRDQRLRVRHVISHGWWLPTPFNGAPNGRLTSPYVQKPDDYQYTPPVVCFGHLKIKKKPFNAQ
ncbi:M43 family zinc metalloprotease [Runella sp.]|uniref:M43 family zinc metalloprotease n=1 Tax=Runella sp. TaxID=1960881 RepID=UPI003019875D